MEILDSLNPQQRAAVIARPGPTLILAGPGSGKTRVLTHRIAYLVGQLGVPPRNIMAVTFTNRAAREMKARVEALLTGGLRGLTIGTFHAICARFLRREAQHLPVTADFVIYDDADQQALMKLALKELNLNDKQYAPQKMLNKISAAKNELIGPEEYAAATYIDEVVKRVYSRYQQLLVANNALDYDDLLLMAVRLFNDNPDVLARYQRYYEHILVDEFQDTNTAQYTLLRLLAQKHRHLYAVGDPDQCFPAGMLIQTPTGARPIQDLRAGDQVVAASGRGASMPAEVRHVECRPYEGQVVRVETRRGFSFRSTPNHIVFARFPHYIPKAKLLRHVVNLRYFGDQRRTDKTPWNAHRVSIHSGDASLRQKLEALDIHMRKGRRNTWRTEFSRLHFDEAQAVAEELSQVGDGLEIVTGAFLVQPAGDLPARRFSLMPASHLHPSMIVAVEQAGEIIPDEIVKVSWETYSGPVYDLEVAELHNYLAGGVVVHNSVYRWRGADYRNVRRFQDDYPDAEVLLLEENYRSTQLILDAAMGVIDRHPGRTRKQLFTQRQGGVQLYAHEAYNEQEEAQFVVDTIAELSRGGQYAPGDCAVMYRTNAQSRAVEEAFLYAGMPYKLVGAQRFYGRKEIKDIIAYLRLVHNPSDSVGLMRVINTPPRGLGAKTLEQLTTVAGAAGVPAAELLRDLATNGSKSSFASYFAGKAGLALAGFGQLLNRWQQAREELSVAQLFDRVIDDVGYADFVNDGSEEGLERWANVMELRAVATESPETGLGEFLEQVALVSDQDTLAEEGQAPTLLTLHAAKGLEFPVVFIVGLDEGILPHQRSFDDPEAMHEERRLMYVGMTRAKDRLYLLRAFRRSIYGDSGPSEASRFFDDIPEHLLKGNLSRKQAKAEAYFQKATRWDGPSSAARASRPAVTAATRYKSGQRVRHKLFGEGIVIDSRVRGDDEEVDVAFEDVGLKRLSANVANLEMLKG